ncbi:hypothetical protein RSOLAG22IIIB_08239 [Rhizoctonia solani]|uniref:Uncharacterized protein n=1 Tax=Rhizoctonia solani TaxID=456999 RepID=A0A0K6FRV0_9AGAM|nr:hypothetical protein RSOLAG22IIIB_08239 [Rhizoctonia solani]
MTSSVGPPVLNITSTSLGDNPAPIINDDRHNLNALSYSISPTPDTLHISSTNHINILTGQAPTPNDLAATTNEDLYSLEWPSSFPDPQEYTDLHSIPQDQIHTAFSRISLPPSGFTSQLLTPPTETKGSGPPDITQGSMATHYPLDMARSNQRPAIDSPNLPLRPRSPRLRTACGSDSQIAGSNGNWPFYDPEEDVDEDPEDVLVLDLEVQSNSVIRFALLYVPAFPAQLF